MRRRRLGIIALQMSFGTRIEASLKAVFLRKVHCEPNDECHMSSQNQMCHGEAAFLFRPHDKSQPQEPADRDRCHEDDRVRKNLAVKQKQKHAAKYGQCQGCQQWRPRGVSRLAGCSSQEVLADTNSRLLQQRTCIRRYVESSSLKVRVSTAFHPSGLRGRLLRSSHILLGTGGVLRWSPCLTWK